MVDRVYNPVKSGNWELLGFVVIFIAWRFIGVGAAFACSACLLFGCLSGTYGEER